MESKKVADIVDVGNQFAKNSREAGKHVDDDN